MYHSAHAHSLYRQFKLEGIVRFKFIASIPTVYGIMWFEISDSKSFIMFWVWFCFRSVYNNRCLCMWEKTSIVMAEMEILASFYQWRPMKS